MSRTPPTADDDLQAERDLWDTYRGIYAGKGVAIEKLFDECVRQFTEPLEPAGGQRDFKELTERGCHPWVLTVLLALVRHQSSIEQFWSLLVGPPARRRAMTDSFVEAADAVDRLFGEAASQVARIGRPSPLAIASELRLYARMINLAQLLAEEMEVRSLDHVSKLLLTRYVERVTGGPHHAAVAGLMSELRPDPDYTADAQKQWRHRDRHLFEGSSSAIARAVDFLVAMSRVLPRSA